MPKKPKHFFYHGNQHPCIVICRSDDGIVAKNIVTNELFFADEQLMRFVKNYNPAIITYMNNNPDMSQQRVANALGVSRMTVIRAIRACKK
jgi:predicted HTH transcriptional regulator